MTLSGIFFKVLSIIYYAVKQSRIFLFIKIFLLKINAPHRILSPPFMKSGVGLFLKDFSQKSYIFSHTIYNNKNNKGDWCL